VTLQLLVDQGLPRSQLFEYCYFCPDSDLRAHSYFFALIPRRGIGKTTVADLHSKMKAARDFATPQLRAVSIREQIARNAAAARGAVSYGQVERINHPLLAALDGRVLRVAGSLLLLGIA
jgi:hypothetical protein